MNSKIDAIGIIRILHSRKKIRSVMGSIKTFLYFFANFGERHYKSPAFAKEGQQVSLDGSHTKIFNLLNCKNSQILSQEKYEMFAIT